MTRAVLAVFLVALVGCSQATGPADPPSREDRRREADNVRGNLGDFVLGTGASSGRAGDALAGNVNKHLWMASLETLEFLPILSTDPFSGVIATDWGASRDAPGERFKVNAYVTDVALSPEALRVAVFRQVLDEQGRWTAAQVAPETPRQIEDAILVRARQLRIAEEQEG